LTATSKLRLSWDAFRTRTLARAGVRAGEWRDWVKANDPVYNSFRHPGRTEKIAASIVMLLIAAIVIFFLLFDWNWLRGPIGRWASANMIARSLCAATWTSSCSPGRLR